MIEVKNAVISGTFLGREDHGIPTCFVYLKYNGTGQSFGGYDLRHYGISFIDEILDVLELRSWEDLPGNPCRVKATHSKVHSIGHFIKDKWYTPENGRVD